MVCAHVQFRQYMEEDLPACSGLAADAWPGISRIVKTDLNRFMKANVELSFHLSTWGEVACVSGNVVGFLFGRIEKDITVFKKLLTIFLVLLLLLKFLMGRYGKVAEKCTFLKKFLATELNIDSCTPRVDGVIELFVVDAEYRGRGIGKELVDRFLSAARSRGARTVSVYTNSSSNWRFYELYRFQRMCSLPDELNSYIGQKDVEGYIYVIDILKSHERKRS